ncbi:hypothetical protein OAB00_01495 [Akkermansiaceae bacterium]|nr:hypothetical protein [Akkermansiaceae bacterium]
MLGCLGALSAQVETAKLKPYIFFSYDRDSPKDHNFGAFHYTNIHRTMPAEMIGPYYQSGLFHTWYRPSSIYDQKDYSKSRDGYHCMEGGAGYKPYLRFRSDSTPHKFTTGAVAGSFGSFSNGPGQGKPGFNRSVSSPTLRWEENVGRYGAAQLSNSLLFPLDGINFESGTNNQMLGYGFYALPLTEPKATIAGTDTPTGNYCWTLFFNTANFSGPICFFTPYHWSKYSIDKPHLRGKCFDNSLLKLNSTYQRETNVVPAKQWAAPNGDIYYVVTSYTMAADEDGVGRLGSMPMTIDGKMWYNLNAWFKGGNPVGTSFGEVGKEIYVRKNTSAKLAYKINDKLIDTANFAQRIKDKDPSASAFRWKGDLVRRIADEELVEIPRFYRLKSGDLKIKAIPKSEVPAASGLAEVKFPEDSKTEYRKSGFNTDPIITPLHPDFKHSDAILDAWKTPGPVAGPFVAHLSDGSQAVYYWYKFSEQPAIMNSYIDADERDEMQRRVELLHAHWKKDDSYFPNPEQRLAKLDQGLMVIPPKGLEIGYVPICVHQQNAGEQLPNFKKITP